VLLLRAHRPVRGDRVVADPFHPGPMPLWFKAACAVAAAYVAWLWFDHLLNVEWILLWATGMAR
jgi:hypothetical protein